jgi:hypothetical protein
MNSGSGAGCQSIPSADRMRARPGSPCVSRLLQLPVLPTPFCFSRVVGRHLDLAATAPGWRRGSRMDPGGTAPYTDPYQ